MGIHILSSIGLVSPSFDAIDCFFAFVFCLGNIRNKNNYNGSKRNGSTTYNGDNSNIVITTATITLTGTHSLQTLGLPDSGQMPERGERRLQKIWKGHLAFL